jgi:hypothetical protein
MKLVDAPVAGVKVTAGRDLRPREHAGRLRAGFVLGPI